MQKSNLKSERQLRVNLVSMIAGLIVLTISILSIYYTPEGDYHTKHIGFDILLMFMSFISMAVQAASTIVFLLYFSDEYVFKVDEDEYININLLLFVIAVIPILSTAGVFLTVKKVGEYLKSQYIKYIDD